MTVEHKVDEYGNQFWYQNGKPHREDSPAIIWANGDQHWYKNGELHREDGPAVIREDGSEEWYKNGESC
jgi:antitoxin component YwqK of YwqJK toxin-antitoxin module